MQLRGKEGQPFLWVGRQRAKARRENKGDFELLLRDRSGAISPRWESGVRRSALPRDGSGPCAKGYRLKGNPSAGHGGMPASVLGVEESPSEESGQGLDQILRRIMFSSGFLTDLQRP